MDLGVYMCEGGCMSTPEQKIIENDGECSFRRMRDGEPFSVCQFFPKVSQFTPKLCQNFEIFCHFAIFRHFCVNIFQKCAKCPYHPRKIVINRDKLCLFLILFDQIVLLCKKYLTFLVSLQSKTVSP